VGAFFFFAHTAPGHSEGQGPHMQVSAGKPAFPYKGHVPQHARKQLKQNAPTCGSGRGIATWQPAAPPAAENMST